MIWERLQFPIWIQLVFWDRLLRILSRKAALKILVSFHRISTKRIVQWFVSLYRISTDWLELHLYPWVWIHTIPVVHIQMTLKLSHCERHKIGIEHIIYTQINRFSWDHFINYSVERSEVVFWIPPLFCLCTGEISSTNLTGCGVGLFFLSRMNAGFGLLFTQGWYIALPYVQNKWKK